MMTLDDLKKLATGSVLFSLDRLIVPRLLKVIYLAGLAAIGLWVFNHVFFSFRFGFGEGLWGVVEGLVFGLLAFLGLRVVCELLMVFFKTHESVVQSMSVYAPSASLIDDVREAIEDLASEEETANSAAVSLTSSAVAAPPAKTPKTTRGRKGSTSASKTSTAKPRTTPRRASTSKTARRSVKPASD